MTQELGKPALTLESLATLPYGASFLEVWGFRSPKETWNGFPVIYTDGITARSLLALGVRGERAGEDTFRFAGYSWEIEREFPATVTR